VSGQETRLYRIKRETKRTSNEAALDQETQRIWAPGGNAKRQHCHKAYCLGTGREILVEDLRWFKPEVQGGNSVSASANEPTNAAMLLDGGEARRDATCGGGGPGRIDSVTQSGGGRKV
jgi:hypothetical protein